LILEKYKIDHVGVLAEKLTLKIQAYVNPAIKNCISVHKLKKKGKKKAIRIG